MPKPLTYIQAEITRVADLLEVDPRSSDFTRTKFLGFADPDEPSTDVTKHDLQTYGGWAKVRYDAASKSGPPTEKVQPDSRGVELRNNYVRGLERKVATSDYLAKRVTEEFTKLLEDFPIKVRKSYPSPKKTSKVVGYSNLLLSDLHFGVDVSNQEVVSNTYSWEIASRRLAFIANHVVENNPNKLPSIRIYLNGDIIDGVIHLNDSNIRPLTEQVWGATKLLVSLIDYLLHHYQGIEVIWTPGNHDRPTYRGGGRALSQRWDSHGSSIVLAIQASFRTQPRVKFSVPASGIGAVPDLSGGHIIVSHGDVEPDVGNVSKAINTHSLQSKLNKLKAGYNLQKVSAALFGHWHTPTIQMLPNGTTILVNGSLIGTNPYAQYAIGEFESEPSQIYFETTPTDAVTNISIVKVKTADQDLTLNNIIQVPTIFHEGELK